MSIPRTPRRIFLKNSAVAMFGVGAAPAWLSRALVPRTGQTQNPDRVDEKKVLVAIFQRWPPWTELNVVVPFGEQRYF